MSYCTVADLSEFLLQAYLDKTEELTPGVCQKHVDQVSAEIDDALRPRFALPLQAVPGTLRRIAQAIAAYRIVGAMTSVMDDYSGTDNDHAYLQDMAKESRRQLSEIASGKLDLGLEVLGEETVDDSGIQVKTSDRNFDDDVWGNF